MLLGVALAADGTSARALIVGAGQVKEMVAALLMAFNVADPAGQLLGAVAVAIAQVGSASAQTTLWLPAASSSPSRC